MGKLYIKYNAWSSGGHSENPNERYSSRTPQYIELLVEGIHLDQVEIFGDSVETVFEPKEGDIVYLVVPRWRTGDTFGYTEGKYSFVACYDKKEDANLLVAEIWEAYKDKSKYIFKPKAPFPEDEFWCGDWNGYFESLNDVEIHELIVEKNEEEEED